MSLNSRKSPLAIRVRNVSLKESLFEEGVELIAGKLESTYKVDQRELSIDEMGYIESLDWGWDNQEVSQSRFLSLIKDKSRGAKFLAWRCRDAVTSNQEFDLVQARKDWAATKELRHWGQSKGEELKACDLAGNLSEDGRRAIYTGKLLHLGIRYGWQANRFLNLYKEVQNPKRPWGSCYQPNQQKVLAIATTPNFNRLPVWAKKVLVNANAFHVSERVGDIWRLLDCSRAWKWCGDLPKGIAEKVGKMPIKSRLLAGIAWTQAKKVAPDWGSHHYAGWQNYHAADWTSREGEPISRAELTATFWSKFQKLSKSSFTEILPWLIQEEEYATDRRYMKSFARTKLEIALCLPYQTLPQLSASDADELLRDISKYLSPEKACATLFGASGKATVKAFQRSTFVTRKWAASLAYGKPDLLQKSFAISNCIGFEADAVPFLKSLSPEVALRMVQTVTFKVRGKIHQVDANLVRDTGYLFSKLQENGGVPNLGRVRCWLSVHEVFAKEYVKRLPDFDLKVNPDFERVQGLCAVDGSWEIEVPTRNAQLKLWGEQLSHCVGGYGEAVNSGRSIIMAVREYGRVTHTVEMVPSGNTYRCQQFFGYGNSHAPKFLRDSVLGALSQANLCKE